MFCEYEQGTLQYFGSVQADSCELSLIVYLLFMGLLP